MTRFRWLFSNSHSLALSRKNEVHSLATLLNPHPFTEALMSVWHNNHTVAGLGSVEFNPLVLPGSHMLVQSMHKLRYNIYPKLPSQLAGTIASSWGRRKTCSKPSPGRHAWGPGRPRASSVDPSLVQACCRPVQSCQLLAFLVLCLQKTVCRYV